MNIEIHLQAQSCPILFEDVKNTYTKDQMYCVYIKEGYVFKYPLCNIYRVKEDYKTK